VLVNSPVFHEGKRRQSDLFPLRPALHMTHPAAGSAAQDEPLPLLAMEAFKPLSLLPPHDDVEPLAGDILKECHSSSPDPASHQS